MIILGIDPGTRITGYALIRVHARGDMEILDFGCIKPPASLSSSDRYLAIYEALAHLIEQYRPIAVSVETQFVYKNVQTAIKLGIARGMVILAAAQRKVPLFEYAPRRAKHAVVGNGGASKEQVQKMVQILFKLPDLPEPEDAADALALAVCHAHTLKWKACLTSSKESLPHQPRRKQRSR